jgi:hypothetical protein
MRRQLICSALLSLAALAARADGGGKAPFDLVWDEVDDNGFPLNPRFAAQDAKRRQGRTDLWAPDARPRVYEDCLDHAGGSGPNPFQTGYQASGGKYCAAFSWIDNPFALKCGLPGNRDDVGGSGAFMTPYQLQGHLNFGVVAYDAIVRWDNAQSEDDWDSDWCMNLYTPQGAGVSGRKAWEPWIHAEWDPLNAGDGFDSGFWRWFRDAVHAGQAPPDADNHWSLTKKAQDESVGRRIDGRHAIAIGLLGLDMGHNDAGAELHPLYGLALHIGGQPARGTEPKLETSLEQMDKDFDNDAYLSAWSDPMLDVPQNPGDDVWALWATNYGNEGYCSTRSLHTLDGAGSIVGTPIDSITFRLPWAKDAHGRPMAAVKNLPSSSLVMHWQVDGPKPGISSWVSIEPARAVVVTLDLPPSVRRPYWFGEIHLQWTPQPDSAPAQTQPPTQAQPPAQAAAQHPVMGQRAPAATAEARPAAEREGNPILNSMTPAQRQIFLAELKRAPKPPRASHRRADAKLKSRATHHKHKPVRHRAPAKLIQPAHAAAHDRHLRGAICKAYGGQVPGKPDYCKHR